MSKYTVQFIVTPAQMMLLRSDAEMSQFITMAQDNGINPQFAPDLGGTPYRILREAASAVSALGIDLQAVIGRMVEEFGVYTLLDSGHWIEVPTSTLDNLVDVDWPQAKIPATEETEEVRRVLQDYTAVVAGENGTSLLRCGYKPVGSNGFYRHETVDTPELIALYRAKFPTGSMVYDLGAWRAVNVTTDER